jgi:hypothetical protein
MDIKREVKGIVVVGSNFHLREKELNNVQKRKYQKALCI